MKIVRRDVVSATLQSAFIIANYDARQIAALRSASSTF